MRLYVKGVRFILVSRLTPRNQVQVVDGDSLKFGRVLNADTGLYTVPTGRSARVTGITMNLDATGADATYAAAIKRGSTFIPVGAHVAVNGISIFSGVMVLEAGDIVTNVGDAGSTNGTCDMTCTVKEFPV